VIRAIARTQLLSYGSLALPLAFAGMPLYIHAPDFYATHHGLALTQIGIILLIVRGLDAVQDPLIGVLSDRYARYRAGIIAIAMGVLGAGFYLLFHPPEPATAIWFTMSVMLTTLAFSVLTINLNTLGSLWSSDSLEQTRITTTREAIGLCGLMLVSIVPTILQRHETAGVAFDQLTWLLFMLIAISGFLFLRWIKRHKNILEHHAAATNHMALWQCLKEQQPFYAIYGINALASSIPSVLVLFFIRDR
jgi:GPH family glycoside/pentoside/hexuronide:cation symporter